MSQGWLSSWAILYKPTNIISTFTPPCACDCHQLLCTSQQTNNQHIHTTLCLWLSRASLYKPTNITSTFTPPCTSGVTVTSYSLQANKHHQVHTHTILCLGLTCHQLLSTTAKPTNIISTFTPPCACDSHPPFSSSQRAPQTLTSSWVFWASRVMILSCSLTSDSSLERNVNNGGSTLAKKEQWL